MNTIIVRCEQFMDELGIPKLNFCRRINIAPSTYYRWRSGELMLSDATLDRIDTYLSRYGF